MIQTLWYIDNSQVKEPLNAGALAAQLNYGIDQFPNAQTISITNFTWVRENYTLLKTYIDAGKTNTGVGITEGPAFRIDQTDGVTTKNIFTGYLDFTGAIIKDRISITCKVVSHATVDWLMSVSSFTFEYLASLSAGTTGAINSSHYRWMPYTLNQIPNYEQAAIATLSVYVIAQEIKKQITEISGLVAEAGGYFTTIPAVVKMIIKIAYLIVLIVTLIKLIEDLIKFLISPVKYHAGMYVRDLMERACTYLNMKFSSDIWAAGSDYQNEFIIPEKLYNAPSKTDSSILGFLFPDTQEQIGYYKGTFKQLLDAMKVKYNAKVIVTVPPGGATPSNQGTITLIRRDKNALPPTYQLPDIYLPEYTYNMEELQSNYLIQYQIDPQDMNTEQNYAGTIYQVITTQKSVNYLPFVLIKGEAQAPIPFARASKKTSLTVPEIIIRDFLVVFDAIDSALVTIVNAMISAVNAITGVINKIANALKVVGIKVNWSIPAIPKLNKSNLASVIDNRIGMMVLSNDHFNIAKIFILKEGSNSKYNKISANNDFLESAKTMWDRYHYVNSMVPASLNPAYSDRPYGNQQMIKLFPKVPFTWSDFLKVVANNRIYAPDGTPAIIESIKFKPPMQQGSSGQAEIKVRFLSVWTLNLQETFLNPDGR